MKKFDWFDFERATQILIQAFSKEPKQSKPTVFHSIRVWSFLFYAWFSEEVCIAWLFHDAIEDTQITYDFIKSNFSEHIANIVLANTLDKSIPKEEWYTDVIKKCYKYSPDAVSVKIADVYDNFIFNTRKKEEWDELEWQIDRCKNFAKLIKDLNTINYDNKLYNLLDEIINF